MTGVTHTGPGIYPKLSEFGYRYPDNPENFIQIPQTIITDSVGNVRNLSGTPLYEELGNGTLVTAWGVYDPGSFTNQYFARVFDPAIQISVN